MGVGNGQSGGQLQILRRAVVDLDAGRALEILPASLGLKERAVDFPMAGIGRFGDRR